LFTSRITFYNIRA